MSRNGKSVTFRPPPSIESVSVPTLCSLTFSPSYQSKTPSKPKSCRNDGNSFGPSFLFHFHFSYSMYNDYDDKDSIVSRTSNFVTFVDKTLFFSNCSKLKKFGVDFGYEPSFASNVNSWTRFAVGKGVEELCLEFHSPIYRLNADEFYELPQLLYANSRFKELRFSLCWVMPKGNVAWNSLNKLSIGYVELSEDVIERILAGSPVLELLELHHCKVFNYHLVLFDEERAVDYERIQNMVVGLLASLAHVKNLTLGTLAIEVLSIMEAKGLSSPLLKCECLTLHTQINKHVLLGIASILKSTPNLETLAMNLSLLLIEHFEVELAELCSYNEEQYWTAQEWTYKCLTLHLKNVKIAGSWWCCDSNFLAFVQFLLRNARVLQKMVINKPNDYRLEDYFQAAQKLLRFPRSSPDAEVLVLLLIILLGLYLFFSEVVVATSNRAVRAVDFTGDKERILRDNVVQYLLLKSQLVQGVCVYDRRGGLDVRRFGSSCRFMNVSSLVDAVFNCQFVCADQDRANDTERIQDMVGGLLASLVHVKNLTLGAWAIEVCLSAILLFCD
ncbi:hypothetical protein C3L33_06307, partial [Rhododendron williamsianum]